MSKHKYISPISIDLGAKNTGVYSAHYPAGSSLDKIKKEGKVYQLEKDAYTLLMANRTATRHQRRGHDRRQMVKRLFKLIWEKHFELPWNKDVQQTISFLLNRRGFSFLAEEYDAEVLSQFPQEVYDELPEELRKDVERNGEGYDFASAIARWTQQRDAEKAIEKKYMAIATNIYLAKLWVACDKYIRDGEYKDGSKPNKLQNLDRNIFAHLKSIGVKGLEQAETGSYGYVTKEGEKKTYSYSYADSINLEAYINHACKTKVIFDSVLALGNTSVTNPKAWDFNAGSFDLEKAEFGQDEPNVKTHLNHLAFALYKTFQELQSGGRHRSKYFEEVDDVLSNNSHTHGYLKRFCAKLNSSEYQPLDKEKLGNLIGHLSNLELKPLRKYFNDKRHTEGDCWSEDGEDRLTKIFEKWILREWRVNPKDKLKAEDGAYPYKELKNKWNTNNTGKVIDFWLENEPNLTIPPYQDNNNRRPPKCQSLILNVDYLDSKYPKWQEWLQTLKSQAGDYLEGYEIELEELKSGKKKPYFSDQTTGTIKTDSGRRSFKQLDARVLQFILDRVKVSDPLNLNEIYSHAKKIKQLIRDDKDYSETKEKLKDAISKLPEEVLKICRTHKKDKPIFAKGTFPHLMCKYYKQRRRAKDGRIFIHPEYRYVKGRGYENTGRFDDKDHLLTYCNHKPRQKRYQLLNDLAGVLQISSDELKNLVQDRTEETIDEKIVGWLKGIKNLETNCTNAACKQKDRRGRLKLDIQNVFGLIYHKRRSESPSDKEIRGILRNSKVKEAAKLHSFCNRAKGLCLIITKNLYDDQRQRQWRKDLEKNPAIAVYLLVQINNLVFKERSGNASTCAVCSVDNAQRMQMRVTREGEDATAKAQRLPAIPTRLIDGAVMRMARIVGSAIAQDKWEKIKPELEQGNEVCVPIITESNRFEFEPSKEELVKSQRTKPRKGKPLERGDEVKIFQSKDERIKQANQGGICPYKGTPISGDGEIDHILPRKSQWGTLNDEANLIWASVEGNQHKTNRDISLAQLRTKYKKSVFPRMDDEGIKQWIIEQIGDGSGEEFKFGQYRSFINLSPDERKAFRHALFLIDHRLREKVINAIDNRTRTLVNGTQRYFAEVLANNLYKMAKSIGKQNLLSFDYFGVEAQDNSRGNGVYNLRKELVDYYRSDLKKYDKEEDKPQDPYSHLIDAQVAFCMAVDAHQKEGSLRLKVGGMGIWSRVDKETGEIDAKGGTIHDAKMFNQIQVAPEKMETDSLKRRKAYEVETDHRRLLNENKSKHIQVNYQIHRDSIIGERFFPLIKLQDGKIKKGFRPENSTPYKLKDFEALRQRFLQKSNNTTNHNYEVWVVNKRTAQDFLMEIGARGANPDEAKMVKLLDGLSYQTVKKSVQDALHRQGNSSNEIKKKVKAKSLSKEAEDILLRSIKKPPETVEDALHVWDLFICEKNFRKDNLLLPVFDQWLELKARLEQADESQPLQEFLKTCDLFGSLQKHPHQKKRKVFSLPVIATIGNIRLKRKTWDGNAIIQTVPEESLAKYGYDGRGRPHTILSKNSIPKKHYTGIPSTWKPEPLRWLSIPKEDIADEVIICAEIKNQDAGRCTARITVSSTEALSLPQNKTDWQGKVVCHDDTEALKEAQDNDKKDNYHCLLSEYKWFCKPFELPPNRRQVSIQLSQLGIIVEFTIAKSAKVKKWLLTGL